MIIVKSEIIHVLEEIEKAENIEILYACEAGSRVWGFSNDESGYDVRFIYKHVNVRDYLSLKDCDVDMEYSGDDIDLTGWDIKKALALHYNNDPSLRECLASNHVYIDKGISNIFDDLGGFDREALKNHYLAMAKRHWKRYCGLKCQEEKVLKYLYVIRCILSWNLLDYGTDPPLTIHELLVNPYAEISDENRIAAIRHGKNRKVDRSCPDPAADGGLPPSGAFPRSVPWSPAAMSCWKAFPAWGKPIWCGCFPRRWTCLFPGSSSRRT